MKKKDLRSFQKEDKLYILIGNTESRIPDVMFEFPQVVQLIISDGVVTSGDVATEVTVCNVVR